MPLATNLSAASAVFLPKRPLETKSSKYSSTISVVEMVIVTVVTRFGVRAILLP
jgi:hypothetical protein